MIVEKDSLVVTGSNVAQYAISAFEYKSSTHTAIWTLADSIDADKVSLELQATGPYAVTTMSGIPLDGEWTDGANYPSGDGSAGGNFSFALSVLPGDVNQDGIVNLTDLTFVASNWHGQGLVGDANGDNAVDLLELTAIASHWNTQLPKNDGEGGSGDGGTGELAAPDSTLSPALADQAAESPNRPIETAPQSSPGVDTLPRSSMPTLMMAAAVDSTVEKIETVTSTSTALTASTASSPAAIASGTTDMSTDSSLVLFRPEVTDATFRAPQSTERMASLLDRAGDKTSAAVVDSLMAQHAATNEALFTHWKIPAIARASNASSRCRSTPDSASTSLQEEPFATDDDEHSEFFL